MLFPILFAIMGLDGNHGLWSGVLIKFLYPLIYSSSAPMQLKVASFCLRCACAIVFIHAHHKLIYQHLLEPSNCASCRLLRVLRECYLHAGCQLQLPACQRPQEAESPSLCHADPPSAHCPAQLTSTGTLRLVVRCSYMYILHYNKIIMSVSIGQYSTLQLVIHVHEYVSMYACCRMYT